MYNKISELTDQATKRNVPLSEIILESECRNNDLTREQVFQLMEERFGVMERSAEKALKEPLKTAGNLISGVASTQNTYADQRKDSICGGFINKVMARALSCSETNASMGRICAAPTAGSCGIVPAVIISLGEREGYSRETVLSGLITASGIGAIITQNATVSGAEGGCQAECGTAAAMAAGAAVEMAGGTPDMVANAVGFALMNSMGLICDPVAGLVQIPCAQRNASQAVNALCSADLGLSGMSSVIPADEIIDAMYRVGKMLPPQLKETAEGGLAATPTAKRIANELYSNKE